MKNLNFFTLTLMLFFTIATFCQETEQSFDWSFTKTYKTLTELNVNYIENGKVEIRKAKAGLKYKVKDKIDNKIYIKFLQITSESASLTADDTYVNMNNSDIVYYVSESDLKPINKINTGSFITGTLLAPIKIRPSITETENKIEGEVTTLVENKLPWELSTDISLGQYLGYRFHLGDKSPFYITPTFTFGTSLLNINESNSISENSTTTLGLTWSTGIIFDLNGFNIALMAGKDYAPGTIGKDWIYNEKMWYSIGFGINLTSKNKEL